MYKIEVSKYALKKLKTIPRNDLLRISSKIDSLSTDPSPADMKKIRGDQNLFRVRVGVYQILYRIFDKVLLIIIADVDHRMDIYK